MIAGLPVLLAGGVDPKDASPGIGAFITFAILALVIILLAWSFTRHQRRIRAHAQQDAAERAEQAAAEQADGEQADAEQAGAATSGAAQAPVAAEEAEARPEEPSDEAVEGAPSETAEGASSVRAAPDSNTAPGVASHPSGVVEPKDDGGAHR
ncbi:hypothetical protein [Ruania zhangjianzhongii]|uniref:hypothetical protein n=1 Tax=Ruania zhangjianzhongii TaxID=2603206 RepID=UPI00143CF2BA|nr:hypothetical protein [Ruania zhangjianzhongii]